MKTVVVVASIAFVVLFIGVVIPSYRKSKHTNPPAHYRTCLRNLQTIENAKIAWAQDVKPNQEATPSPSDLGPYLREVSMNAFQDWTSLRCPKGGEYTIGGQDTPPLCTYTNDLHWPHKLPQK